MLRLIELIGRTIIRFSEGLGKILILILNKKWRGGYAGIGLRFEDEDFKYLFGTIPRVSLK